MQRGKENKKRGIRERGSRSGRFGRCLRDRRMPLTGKARAQRRVRACDSSLARLCGWRDDVVMNHATNGNASCQGGVASDTAATTHLLQIQASPVVIAPFIFLSLLPRCSLAAVHDVTSTLYSALTRTRLDSPPTPSPTSESRSCLVPLVSIKISNGTLSTHATTTRAPLALPYCIRFPGSLPPLPPFAHEHTRTCWCTYAVTHYRVASIAPARLGA